MPKLVALVDDLMFMSRIREAGRAAGVEVASVRGEADLASAARDAALVLVDADSERLPWRAAVQALRAERSLDALAVVAFVSHVHADRAEAARQAGCTRVLARSAFVKELPSLLLALPGR